MTWRMSRVAGSITGRHHGRWEKPQDAECASSSSGGSCGRRVTQWWCLNDCYRLAETRREKLVNGAWSYCDKPSDPAIPGPLPISTLPKHATRLIRIGTDIVNVEMVTDDGGRIPPQYQEFTISRFVVSSWDTGTMWTYAAKICQLSHRTYHGMQREFVRNNDSSSRSVGREWEEMTGYPAVRNHTNCVDLRNLGDARHVTQSSELHESGPQECLSPHPYQGRRRVQNRVSHPACSSSTQSCRSGWQKHQLPYHEATTPIRGDKSSAEQRRLKRGMTLPEWRTKLHLTTEKSSGDKCTQRAGISVPREESTYAPSIRKIISPPSEFTAKAQSQRQPEQTKRTPKRRKASRNTKQVSNQSESKKGQSKWKNETKQAKRQAKSQTSEIQRRRLPKDASVNKDHLKSTEVLKSAEARRQSTTDWGLSRRRSNKLQKGGWPCQNASYRQAKSPPGGSLPRHWEVDREVYREVDQPSHTDKPKAHRDAIYWDALSSRPRSLPRSWPAKSTMSTKILLKPPIESATRSRP